MMITPFPAAMKPFCGPVSGAFTALNSAYLSIIPPPSPRPPPRPLLFVCWNHPQHGSGSGRVVVGPVPQRPLGISIPGQETLFYHESSNNSPCFYNVFIPIIIPHTVVTHHIATCDLTVQNLYFQS